MPWIVFLYMLLALPAGYSMDIYWNASNPIFRIDNTDHIIDVNKGKNPFEYDQVNIICPTYSKGTKAEDTESYIIYNVSKEEYDSCRITNSNARIIAVCDKPQQLMYFTITFRSFTPQPGGLEFRPGQDYYFVSTSTGDAQGLHRRAGGRCATHNMKVVFKVCCQDGVSGETTVAGGTANGTATPAIGGTNKNDTTDKSNKSSSQSPSSPGTGGDSYLESVAVPAQPALPAAHPGPGPKPSIIITTIRPPSLILNNTINDSAPSSASSSPSSPSAPSATRSQTQRPLYSNANNANKNFSTRRYNKSGLGVNPNPHLTSLWGNSANGNVNNNLNNSILVNNPTTSKPSSTSSTSTPYWWRPHFTKLPSLKHNYDAPRSDQSWPPHSSGSGDGSGDKAQKTGAWFLVVGAGVAVAVACLIVCGLFACTNYLFFPPRRKETPAPAPK